MLDRGNGDCYRSMRSESRSQSRRSGIPHSQVLRRSAPLQAWAALRAAGAGIGLFLRCPPALGSTKVPVSPNRRSGMPHTGHGSTRTRRKRPCNRRGTRL